MATDHDRVEELDPRLAAAIAGLEDREPGTDLWPGIATRIAPRRPSVLTLRWPVAAAAALALVAGSAAVTSLLVRDGVPGAPMVASGTPAPDGTLPLLPAGYDEAAQSIAAAIGRLEQAYAAAASSLPADVREEIASSLAALDQAIAEARTRAGAAPDDLGAARYLTRTMQRKLDMLETAATMASQRS